MDQAGRVPLLPFALSRVVRWDLVTSVRGIRPLAIGMIALLGVALRLQNGVFTGPAAGFDGMQSVNISLAASLSSGLGYMQTVDEMTSVPNEYTLPGYPLLLTPVAAAVGASAGNAQVLNAAIDGILGPTLIAAMLGGPAGILAALLYAISQPTITQTGFAMPDALGSVLVLAIVTLFVRGLRSQRPHPRILGCGVTIGLAAWFRGEAILLLPLLLVVASLLLRDRRIAVLLVAGWLVAVLPLGVFWQATYGHFSLSRPGVGVRLWEGLGEEPNPWGFEARDEALAAFLETNGYAYGSSEGDAVAVTAALEAIRSAPSVYGLEVVHRAHKFIDLFDSRLALGLPIALLIVGLSRPLGLALIAVWLSRAALVFFHMEVRDLVPALIVPIVGTGYLVVWAFSATRRFQRVRALRRSASAGQIRSG